MCRRRGVDGSEAEAAWMSAEQKPTRAEHHQQLAARVQAVVGVCAIYFWEFAAAVVGTYSEPTLMGRAL